MDIELLHTFLEVDRARHFGRAAEKLCVTQAAVSARVKLLETTLGTALFVRNRNNIQLTPAGEQLKLHAETIVSAWQRIRNTTRNTKAPADVLSIGTPPDIGALLLPAWFAALGTRNGGEAGFHGFMDHPVALLQMLNQRMLDLVLTTEAPDSPELEVREIADIDLVLVSTSKAQSRADALASHYVYVDWGDWFRVRHDQHYPPDTRAHRITDSAMLAATMLLYGAGAAYLPRRILAVQPWRKRLHVVADAPAIAHPLYALLSPAETRKPQLEQALARARETLHDTASSGGKTP